MLCNVICLVLWEKVIEGTEKSERTVTRVLSHAIPSTMSAPWIGNRYRGTWNTCSWISNGTVLQTPQALKVFTIAYHYRQV